MAEVAWQTLDFVGAHPRARRLASSLADSDNLPAPAVIAQEIVEDLQAALEQFRLIAGDLGAEVPEVAV